MIEKAGVVTITEDDINITSFVFDGGGTMDLGDCGHEAVEWAIKRLQGELDLL